MNVNAFLQKDYENEPPSGPKKTNPIQTQSKPVLSAVEWANFFKGQNRLPKNPATPLFSHDLIIAQHQLASGYEYFSLN